MQDKKSYYAIIPATVRYDKDLPANAKLLYAEITALSNETGYCWATNNYFAELYGVSKRTISRWINILKAKGYINVEDIKKDGEIIGRKIFISDTPMTKMSLPIDKNVTTPMTKMSPPIDKNVTQNNINKNITNEYIDTILSTDVDGPTPHSLIVEKYNTICKSLNKVRIITETRRDKMRTLWKNVKGDMSKIEEVFKKAEASDFLSGRSGRWRGCNFDWLINYSNFVKVLEGYYDNKKAIDYSDAAKDSPYGW